MPRSSVETRSPLRRRTSPSASRTLTDTVSPTARRKCSGRRRGRSRPGLLTSSAYGPRSSSASSAGWTCSDAAVIASRSTPPSRSTMTRTVRARPEPVSWTSKTSRPNVASTGSIAATIVSRSGTGAHLLAVLDRPGPRSALRCHPPTNKKRGLAPTSRLPVGGRQSRHTPVSITGFARLNPSRTTRDPLQTEDLGELVGDGRLELIVGARARIPVGPPVLEPGGVAEAVALEVLVRDFGDELDPQRLPAHVLLGIPAAGRARHTASRLLRLGVGPLAPRMPLEGVLPVRLELFGELLAHRRREAARHPDVVERPLVVVEAQEQRPDAVTVLVRAEPGDDAIGRPLVLDLEPGAFVLAVLPRARLGDDAVEAGALELLEPVGGNRRVGGRGGEMDGRLGSAQHPLQALAPLRQRVLTQVVVALGEEIERDEARRGLGRQLRHPAGGRVDTHLQEIEVETLLGGDHDLAVEHRALGERAAQLLDELGEVPVERALVAAAELDLVAVAEHDAAEAVPLRLVEHPVAGRELADELGQHRRHRRGGPGLHHPPAKTAGGTAPGGSPPSSAGPRTP